MRIRRFTRQEEVTKTPLATVAQGLAAGLVGNAMFTAFQEIRHRAQDANGRAPRTWGETPEPAQVGHRVAAGVFRRDVPLEKAGAVAHVVHWIYGTSWGAVYALIEESVRQPLVSGAALTTSVMATDYTLLPLMKLYRPPWRYSAKALGADFATHLVHGLSVAGAYKALDAMRSP